MYLLSQISELFVRFTPLVTSIIYVVVAIIKSPRFRLICRFLKKKWYRYKLKQAGAKFAKCVNDYFSNQQPLDSRYCKDCKHSTVSKNNGNLICLNDECKHFGFAVPPEQDWMCYGHFERK